MKKTIIIIVLLIAIHSFGQNKWEFGTVFSIDNNLSSEFLADGGNGNGFTTDYNQFNYTVGLIAQYQLKTKFFLESGIEYSNKDFTGRYSCPSCDYGFPKEVISQRFLEIPILLKYYLIDKKFNLVIVPGLINGFSIQNELVNNGYLLSGTIGAEIGYELIQNWNFQLGADYSSSLTHFYVDDNYNLKSNGFYFKIMHSFK
jgi:hypothetical protein